MFNYHKQLENCIPTLIPDMKNDNVLCVNLESEQVKRESGIVLAEYSQKEDLAVVISAPKTINAGFGDRPGQFKPGDIVYTTRKKGRVVYMEVKGKDYKKEFSIFQEGEITMVKYHCPTCAKAIKDQRSSGLKLLLENGPSELLEV